MNNLPQLCLECLHDLVVRPYRIQLRTHARSVTVPLLRSVWGASLHDLDSDTYLTVFRPADVRATPGSLPVDPAVAFKAESNAESNTESNADRRDNSDVPGYVLTPSRSVPTDVEQYVEFDFLLIGKQAIDREDFVFRAWDIASGRGLGAERTPFVVSRKRGLCPGGEILETPATWRMSALTLPFDLEFGRPCRLVFPVPLRIRHRGQLVTQPSFVDIVVAGRRRIEELLTRSESWAALEKWGLVKWDIEQQARSLPCEWRNGARDSLRRFSRSQEQVLDLQGVTGALELPQGMGGLWPIIAAASWLHIGKATTNGLGEFLIEVL